MYNNKWRPGFVKMQEKEKIEVIVIPGNGPYRFSIGTCMYPLNPVSSQIPATNELMRTVNQPIQVGKLSKILYCDLNASSGNGINRKVTTKLDWKTTTKSIALINPYFQTLNDNLIFRKLFLRKATVCLGAQLPLKYFTYAHKTKIIIRSDQGAGMNV